MRRSGCNDICCYDLRLNESAATCMPEVPGWEAYLYVFTGEIEINGARFRRSGEWSCDKAGGLTVRATRPSLLMAFLISPDAEVTREGTIGR